MANSNRVGEIEAVPLLSNPEIVQKSRSVRTKVPEVEVRLYKQGKGPIDVFKATLGGWDQDQLEIRQILDRYGFKSVYAYNPERGRTVPIRFNPRNGRSLLTYNDGGVINLDGEPKNTLINPHNQDNSRDYGHHLPDNCSSERESFMGQKIEPFALKWTLKWSDPYMGVSWRGYFVHPDEEEN